MFSRAVPVRVATRGKQPYPGHFAVSACATHEIVRMGSCRNVGEIDGCFSYFLELVLLGICCGGDLVRVGKRIKEVNMKLGMP